jgi:hypothetical protein
MANLSNCTKHEKFVLSLNRGHNSKMDKVLKSEINFGLTFLTLVFCKNFKLVAKGDLRY